MGVPQTSVELSTIEARCTPMLRPGFFNSWNMENPSYYSIIPSIVRYDKELTFFQIVLYGEISALANKHGYCFASNGHFSSLFDKTPVTISRAINKLAERGHVMIDPGEEQNNRKIYLTPISKMIRGVIKNDKGGYKKDQGGVIKNDNHNTTRVNNTSNTKSVIARAKEIEPLETEKKYTPGPGEISELRLFALKYFQDVSGRMVVPGGGLAGKHLYKLAEAGITKDQIKSVVDKKTKEFKDKTLKSEYYDPVVMFKPDNFYRDLNSLTSKPTKQFTKEYYE